VNATDVSAAVATTKAWVLGSSIHEPQIEDIEDSRKGSIIARADAAGYPSIEASLEFGRCAGSAESRPCAAPPTRIASPP
jgi:hypothetical protein